MLTLLLLVIVISIIITIITTTTTTIIIICYLLLLLAAVIIIDVGKAQRQSTVLVGGLCPSNRTCPRPWNPHGRKDGAACYANDSFSGASPDKSQAHVAWPEVTV